VWLEFKEATDKKQECLHCGLKLTSNATRMEAHLSTCQIYTSADKAGGSKTLSRYMDRISKEEMESLQQKYARAVFSSGCALSLFDKPEWDDFFASIRPAFVKPTRRVLTSKFLGIEKESVEKELQIAIKQSNPLVFVIDTSTINKKCQLNVIVLTPKPYFVTTIDCAANKKSAQFIYSQLKPYIEQYSSTEPTKVTAIVTDNAINMRNIDGLLVKDFPHAFSYGCSAHTMNNIMKKLVSLNSVEIVIDKCQKVVNEITKSTKKFSHYTDNVAAFCKENELPKFTLRSFCVTRYN